MSKTRLSLKRRSQSNFAIARSKRKIIRKSILRLAAFPQPHVLKEYMKESGLKHGDIVLADLHSVCVMHERRESFLFFCPMEKLTVKKRIAEGDSSPLPDDVALIGKFKFSGYGLPDGKYDFRDVELTSNGMMQVRITDTTTLVRCD